MAYTIGHDNISDFPSLTPEQVAQHFGLAANASVERAALHFMVGVTRHTMGISYLKGIKGWDTKITDQAIDEIKLRYDIYKKYAPDFFPKDYKTDYDVLAVAVICNSYRVEVINGQVPFADNNELKFRIPGIDDSVIERACTLLNESMDLTDKSLNKQKNPECLFLNYMNVFALLHNQQKSRGLMPWMWDAVLIPTIDHIRPLLDLDKEMCRDLLKLMNKAKKIVNSKSSNDRHGLYLASDPSEPSLH